LSHRSAASGNHQGSHQHIDLQHGIFWVGI
jgi:hypothetical protein